MLSGNITMHVNLWTIIFVLVHWISRYLLFLQSLLLLHYLLRNGSERVVTNARDHIYDMKPLESYTYFDEHGKDQGINGNFCSRTFYAVHLRDIRYDMQFNLFTW